MAEDGDNRARALVEESFAELGVDASDPDLDVLEAGVLDSLALVSLIAELEERAGIEIPFEQLEIDDFRTVSSIARVVDDQLGSAATDGRPR